MERGRTIGCYRAPGCVCGGTPKVRKAKQEMLRAGTETGHEEGGIRLKSRQESAEGDVIGPKQTTDRQTGGSTE